MVHFMCIYILYIASVISLSDRNKSHDSMKIKDDFMVTKHKTQKKNEYKNENMKLDVISDGNM